MLERGSLTFAETAKFVDRASIATPVGISAVDVVVVEMSAVDVVVEAMSAVGVIVVRFCLNAKTDLQSTQTTLTPLAASEKKIVF